MNFKISSRISLVKCNRQLLPVDFHFDGLNGEIDLSHLLLSSWFRAVWRLLSVLLLFMVDYVQAVRGYSVLSASHVKA